MRAQARRLRKTERHRQARAVHVRILRKVNQQPNSPRVRRVLGLIQLMREAETRRLELYERTRHDAASYEDELAARGKFRDPELQALYAAFNDRLRKLETEMRRYRWSPTVRASEYHGLHQMFVWPGRRDSGESWENWAVFWLTNHIDCSGSAPSPILRFRQCRQCSKWLYAMTDYQAYCGRNCRQKAHADNPEFRAKRARFMRDYRQREKEEDQKAREEVKYTKAGKRR